MDDFMFLYYGNLMEELKGEGFSDEEIQKYFVCMFLIQWGVMVALVLLGVIVYGLIQVIKWML